MMPNWPLPDSDSDCPIGHIPRRSVDISQATRLQAILAPAMLRIRTASICRTRPPFMEREVSDLFRQLESYTDDDARLDNVVKPSCRSGRRLSPRIHAINAALQIVIYNLRELNPELAVIEYGHRIDTLRHMWLRRQLLDANLPFHATDDNPGLCDGCKFNTAYVRDHPDVLPGLRCPAKPCFCPRCWSLCYRWTKRLLRETDVVKRDELMCLDPLYYNRFLHDVGGAVPIDCRIDLTSKYPYCVVDRPASVPAEHAQSIEPTL